MHIFSYWYQEKAVWFNQIQKSRIIQLLYDLNDIDFELIYKNNFELDTSWPSIQVNSNRFNNSSNNQPISRNRTVSISSSYSINIDKDQVIYIFFAKVHFKHLEILIF